MSIDNILPVHPLTEAEEIEITKAFSSPAVIKYLRILGTEDSKELLSLRILDMPAVEIANRHHYVSGKLAVISTLLFLAQNS